MRGLYQDNLHQMNGTNGGTVFSDYLKALFEHTYQKLSEYPEELKPNFNVKDLIMKQPVSEKDKAAVKTYVAIGVEAIVKVDEKAA